MMTSLRRDLRFMLGRGRGRIVSLLAIVSLALGIAGNAVAFSLVEVFLIRPLPYPEADRLVLLGERERGTPASSLTSLISSLAIWAEYRDRSSTLAQWAAFSPRHVSLAGDDGAIPLLAALITPGFFPLLGAQLASGRLPDDGDAHEGAARVAVLSGEYARRAGAAGAAGAAPGTIVRLDGESYEVVGVLREGFEFLTAGVDVWLPLRTDPYSVARDQRSVISVARMAPGATLPAVKAEVAAIARQIEEEYPETHAGWTADAIHLQSEFPDPQSRMYLAIMQLAVFLVLLIACANIVNLLLVRAQDRSREIALRTVMGAGRMRITGMLLRESLLLAGIGAVLGIGIAAVAIPLIAAQLGTVLSSAYQPSLSPRVLLFTATTALACGVAFGLIPALQTLKQDQMATLRQGPGAGTGSRRSRRLRAALVAGEVALCFVTLAAGGVLIRSFLEARHGDPGFASKPLLTVLVTLPHWRYEGDAATLVIDQIQDRVAMLPGVAAVTAVNVLPQELLPPSDTFRIDGRPLEYGARVPRAVSVRAAPTYTETLGVPILDGRFFEPSDRAGTALVAVVSRALAEQQFAGRSAVGERLSVRGQTREIVGVAGNVRQSILGMGPAGFEATIYLPFAQEFSRRTYFVVRATCDPRALAGPIRAAIRGIDPDIAVPEIETMDEFAGRYLVGIDIINLVLTGFGAFALLLASLGIYGLVAFAVRQRAHEIAVRMAIGAEPRAVVTMVAMQGARSVAAGLALGMILVLPVLVVVSRVLTGFGLTPARPLMVAGIAVLLAAVAMIASVLPALRAAAIAPAGVLKAE
jgi:putative ABC transport system permease protein